MNVTDFIKYTGWSEYDAGCVFEFARDFTLDDVAGVLLSYEGTRDEESWLVEVRLLNNKYAGVRAFCDYTGWD